MSEAADLGVIALRGLTATGFHGVFDFERAEGQTFVVDVEVTSVMPAADDIAETVDYAALARTVIDLIEGEPVDLIETLAARIADAALAHPLVQFATICVHKPQAPIGVEVADVSVTITRRKP